jgi:2-polyprenyl-3-methyl-5-hydroxy-6-metoxy-1,4-benzoquinol methylase
METVSAETLFDSVNIKYQEEYADNPALVESVRKLIGMLEPGSKILDVGCGTGIPVASMLAAAGMHVTGIDISQKMVDIVQKQVVGSFSKADMVQYEPSQEYDAVFVVFSHMQLSPQELHTAMLKYAACLRVGGLLLLATVPSDNYSRGKSVYDETLSYLEDFPTPFMGMQITTTLYTASGLRRFLKSIGLDIVDHTIASFQPKTNGSLPEDQSFTIAKRTQEHPLIGPYPLPKIRPRRNTLNAEAWPPFVELACRHDIDAVLEALKSNKRVVDIGSGHGGKFQQRIPASHLGSQITPFYRASHLCSPSSGNMLRGRAERCKERCPGRERANHQRQCPTRHRGAPPAR